MSSGHELDYGSIHIERAIVADPEAAAYTVCMRCTCGFALQGAGGCYVEASQKLHAAFAVHQQMMDNRAKFLDGPASHRP